MHAPLSLQLLLDILDSRPSRFQGASMEASGAINDQKEDHLHFQSFGATSRIPGTAVAISAPSD